MCPSWESKLDFARVLREKPWKENGTSRTSYCLIKKNLRDEPARKSGNLEPGVELHDLHRENFGQLGHTSLGFQVPIATKTVKKYQTALKHTKLWGKSLWLGFRNFILFVQTDIFCWTKTWTGSLRIGKFRRKSIYGKNAFPSVIWLTTENRN